MSATTPQLHGPQEGSQAPNQIEFLYERYRPLLKWLLIVAVIAYAGWYGLKWQRQSEVNSKWSAFVTSIGIDATYADLDRAQESLADALAGKDLATLEQGLAAADPAQKPYVLLAIGRKALLERNFDRAESALATLESEFPKHSLVVGSPYPVQVREEIKKEKPKDDASTPRQKKPELKPAKAGSLVTLLREQIATAKAYTVPAQFARVEPPADAKKVKFELSGDNGSFVIALMAAQAPRHCEEFLKLATENGGFWKDLCIDEVQRNGKGMGARRPMQLHLGFESTKDADRTKWSKTDPSKHEIEFEKNSLSHFPGAVSAREGKDGKSCVDRFWVAAEDAAEEDGTRVVFGYVVEGLDTIKKVCEATMTAQEEDAGIGVPTDVVKVVSVTVLN